MSVPESIYLICLAAINNYRDAKTLHPLGDFSPIGSSDWAINQAWKKHKKFVEKELGEKK